MMDNNGSGVIKLPTSSKSNSPAATARQMPSWCRGNEHHLTIPTGAIPDGVPAAWLLSHRTDGDYWTVVYRTMPRMADGTLCQPFARDMKGGAVTYSRKWTASAQECASGPNRSERWPKETLERRLERARDAGEDVVHR